LCAEGIDKESVLHKFSRTSGGYYPFGALLEDGSGNLYGTASQGGLTEQDGGLVFELSPVAGGGYTYAVLYYFTGPEYGPSGSLVMDSAGNLFGTVSYGGTSEVYELSPNISGTWTETSVYILPSGNYYSSPVVMDAAGNLYGAGGGGTNGIGCIFELSPSTGGWTFRDIYDFSGTDGRDPNGVILGASGELYGTTYEGGNTGCDGGFGCGVVFELRLVSGAWMQRVIHEFNGGNGWGPEAALTFDGAGNLYGSATQGGEYGYGVIFELEPSGSGWESHPVHDFKGYPDDGAFPDGLTFFNASLYGTTDSGGNSNECEVDKDTGCGTVFELSPSGGSWKGTLLHNFSGYWDGGLPGQLIFGPEGNAFGVTQIGGTESDGGVVYELTPGTN